MVGVEDAGDWGLLFAELAGAEVEEDEGVLEWGGLLKKRF